MQTIRILTKLAVSFALMAVMGLVGAHPAWAAGWNSEHTTYSVEGQDGYYVPGKNKRVSEIFIDGDNVTIDLTDADATYSPEGEDRPSVTFYISGDNVTIKADPKTEFTNVLFVIAKGAKTPAETPVDGAFTIKFENYRFASSSKRSVDMFDKTSAAVEIVYEGPCRLPHIYGGSSTVSDEPITFKPGSNGSSLAIPALYLTKLSAVGGGTKPIVFNRCVVFDGGTVDIEGCVSAGSIALKNGCKMTGALETGECEVLGSNQDYDFMLSAKSITLEDSSLTVDESTIGPNAVAMHYIIGNPAFGELGGSITIAEPVPSKGTSITIDNSTVTIDSNSFDTDESKSGSMYLGIGDANQISIKNNSHVTVKRGIRATTTEHNLRNMTNAGIGGHFSSIDIDDSTVHAEGVMGAGIGWGASAWELDGAENEVSTISIFNSDVTASSVAGSGIGGCANDSATSSSSWEFPTVNVAIDGTSDVKAYSQYGGGIGGTYRDGTIVPDPGWVSGGTAVTPEEGGGWGSDEDRPVTSSALPLNSLGTSLTQVMNDALGARVGDSVAPERFYDNVNLEKGTLTVGGEASVYAESGICAIGMSEVKTSRTIVQNTLQEAVEDGGQTVYIVTGESEEKLGDVRTGFRSVAQTVGVSGDAKLQYGSGDGAVPMLNWNDASGQELYAETFTVEPNAFNRFWADPEYVLHGEVTVKLHENTSGGTNVLRTNVDGLLPKGIDPNQLSYQWYKDGSALTDGTYKNYSVQNSSEGDGIYYCVVTASQKPYTGSLVSQSVTVNNGIFSELTAPELESVSPTTITLKAPTDDKVYKYSIDYGTTWQDELSFSRLNNNTTYSIVRRAPSAGADGPISAPLTVTTSSHSNLPTDADITYDYVNERIGYSPSVNVYADASCTQPIEHGGVISDYIGSYIYVRYKDVTATGPDVVAALMVGPRANAPAITIARTTDTSITVASALGVDYNIAKQGATPGSSSVLTGTGKELTFSNLDPATTYVVYARMPATENSFHSKEGMEVVKTKSAGPAAPSVTGSYEISTTYSDAFVYTVTASGLPEGTVYEYKMDNGTWQKSATFDRIAPESKHTFYARAAETADSVHGSEGSVTVTFNLLAGSGSVTLFDWEYGNAAKVPVPTSETNDTDYVTYEYKLCHAEDDSYSSTVPKDAGDYTVRATFAATATCTQAIATDDFSITKAQLMVKANDVAITYGDDPEEKLTCTYSGFKNGETEGSLLEAGELNGMPRLSTAYKQGDAIGDGPFEIAVSLDGVTAKNYELTSGDGELIVSPRVISIVWTDPEGGHVVGDGKVVTATISNVFGNDDVSLVITGHDADSAGAHTARVTGLTGSRAANYALPGESACTHEYTVVQSGTSLSEGMTVENGEGEATTSFTYGEAVVVKVKPEATGMPSAVNSLADAASNQMTLWYRPATGEDIQLCDPVDAGEDGVYVLRYDTRQQTVPVGAATLVAKFSGTDDLASAEVSANITLAAKQLAMRLVTEDGAAITKIYDGTTAVESEVAIALDGVLADDEVNAKATTVAYASKGASDSIEVRASGISLVGEDAAFYSLDAQDVVTQGSITKATLTARAEDETIAYRDAAPSGTIEYVGFAVNEDASVLSGQPTFTFLDDEGNEYTAGSPVGSYRIVPDVSGVEAANYRIVPEEGVLTVATAALEPEELTVDVTASTITEGQALSESELSGTVSWADGTLIEGALSWKDPGQVLEAGEHEVTFVFTPSDAGYAPIELTVVVTVEQTYVPTPPVSNPTYDIEIPDNTHGSVEVDPEHPHKGDEVVVTPVPDKGFEVTGVTVTDASGDPMEVVDNGDGTWSFTQPGCDVTLTVTFACDGGALCPSQGFTDVDQSLWYHGAVDWALAGGVMNGYEGSTNFGPNDVLTREQAAAVLYNYLAEGATGADQTSHTDVDQSQWYAEAVNWAVTAGVMNGYEGSDEFGVGDALTREQFCAVIANAVGADVDAADESVLDAFPDADGVGPWARKAVAWAVEAGVINGVELEGGGRALQASRALNRAEMAAMMMNADASGVLTR